MSHSTTLHTGFRVVHFLKFCKKVLFIPHMIVTTQKLCNWFITHSNSVGKPICPIKINHLVIMANWRHFLRHHSFLINEAVEVWENGPVLPTIFHEYKNDPPFSVIEHPSRRQPELEPEELTALEPFLLYIWDLFAKYTPQQLSRINTAPLSPWAIAQGKNATISHQAITDEHLLEYDRALFN